MPRRKPRLTDLCWFALFSILAPGEWVLQVTDDSKPKIVPRLCTRDDTKGGCPERMEAMARGEFLPDFESWGWVRTDIPLRYMSDAAHYYAYVDRQDLFHPNHTGKPYTWTCCPWCAAELPSLGLLRKEAEQPPIVGQCDGEGTE